MIIRCPLLRLPATLLLLLTLFPTARADEEAGFVPLFDGQTLDGWRGDENFWRVENDTVIAESTPANPCRENTFLVWDQGEVDNFELRLQFRISGSENANSGIQFRGAEREDGHVIGYQADIDKAGQWVGALYDEATGRRLLASRGQKTIIDESGSRETTQFASAEELFAHVRPDDWNDYHILAVGPHITLSLNGYTTAEVIDRQAGERDLIGKLALQLHSGPPMKIEFRDVRLKRLPMGDYKKVVFVAGSPSHGYMSHEHNAGCLLLADRLNRAREEQGLPVIATVYRNGWPKDPTAFDNVDTVVSYCDGGGRHYLNDRLAEFDELMSQGVGLVCIHYAVETEIGEPGDHFLKWLGGYFEPHWSVNPHWTADFDDLPDHEITRGVNPFEIRDEWYYHMRFVPDMKGVTPILTDRPPRESLNRKDGHHSGNPFVREAVLQRKEPQHVAWAYQRPGGGRGFGFTGGHFHKNWQHDDFRKIVLNAIVWSAGLEVPTDGVKSATPSDEEMEANQDEPKPQPKQTRRDRRSKKFTSPVSTAAEVSRDRSDAVDQLDVHEDLQVELFAAEPVMRNPTNIDIDHRGRVWVCEVVNYRRFRNGDMPMRDEGDRILILEDTDGDGLADKDSTYYQGTDIDSAHGICVLGTVDDKGTRALVSAKDQVFFLIDDDGDLKADRKEVLFTGISGTEHDHGIHAFVFGPDGKLYFNFGNAGKQIKDKEGKTIIDKAGNVVDDSINPYQQGMVFRCNLDGSDFETLGWNFRNNWEVCVDSFGTLWQSDNDDDGNRGTRINYVMEYGNYGYCDERTGAGWREARTGWHDEIPLRHWHLNDPGVMPNLLQTGAGSPTGICVYEGDLLPEVFQNQIIHCDAGPNVVRCYPVQVDGAGYTATSIDVLHGARDNWFRPSDVCVAPDGSLLVADWYDPGVGGHRMQDVERGRLFRVTPRGHNGDYSVPEQDFTTPAGAVKALQSPNLATRYVAWTAIQEMGADAKEALLELWRSDLPRMRARALWALSKLDIDDDTKVLIGREALQDENPDIRVAAFRSCRQLRDQFDVVEIHDVIDLQDPSPAVRREMLIGIRELNIDAVTPIWAELALQYDGEDRWYLEALGIGAEGRWEGCLDQYLKLVKNDLTRKPVRDIVWRSRAEQTPELLRQIIETESTPIAELPRYFRAFDFQTSPQTQEVLLELAKAEFEEPDRTAYVNAEAFARLEGVEIDELPEMKQALDGVLDRNRGTPQFVKLVDKFGVSDRFDDLLELAISNPQSQLAADAIRTLLQRKQQGLIREILEGDAPQTRENLITALATAADGRSVGLLREVVSNLDQPVAIRRAALRAMGQNLNGAQQLLELAKSGEYDEVLEQALAGTLHTAQWRSIKEPAAKIFPPPAGKDAQPLPSIDELLSRKGNVKRGRMIFHSTGTCHTCHIVNKLGREVGPDLSEIGKKLSKQALFESILYPSAGISHNYEMWSVLTTDGRVIDGLLISETGGQIQLKDAKAIVHTIPADEIDVKQKQDVSLMPADLQKVMTAEELVDVVEYMTTLKKRK